jgi:hypothetical protein
MSTRPLTMRPPRRRRPNSKTPLAHGENFSVRVDGAIVVAGASEEKAWAKFLDARSPTRSIELFRGDVVLAFLRPAIEPS